LVFRSTPARESDKIVTGKKPPADSSAIDNMNEQALGGEREAMIVDALWESSILMPSWVACIDPDAIYGTQKGINRTRCRP
jgi:predicted N-acetyltransferase YhbS